MAAPRLHTHHHHHHTKTRQQPTPPPHHRTRHLSSPNITSISKNRPPTTWLNPYRPMHNFKLATLTSTTILSPLPSTTLPLQPHTHHHPNNNIHRWALTLRIASLRYQPTIGTRSPTNSISHLVVGAEINISLGSTVVSMGAVPCRLRPLELAARTIITPPVVTTPAVAFPRASMGPHPSHQLSPTRGLRIDSRGKLTTYQRTVVEGVTTTTTTMPAAMSNSLLLVSSNTPCNNIISNKWWYPRRPPRPQAVPPHS